MKLMIAIPTLDFIHFEFARCLTGLTMRLAKDGVDFDVCFKGGTLVYNGRDALAAEAVVGGYTHVLWLDTDMVFNDDAVYQLVKANKRFVTGVYHSRHAPYASCIYSSIDQLNAEKVREYPEDLFEIAGCGFGIVMTQTSLLREVYCQNGYCFQPTPQHGEDIAFCQRVTTLGEKMWCAPNVKAGHIGHVTIWPDM